MDMIRICALMAAIPLSLAGPAFAQQQEPQPGAAPPALVLEQARARQQVLQVMEARQQQAPQTFQLNPEAVRQALAQRVQPDPGAGTQAPETDAQGRPIAPIDWGTAAIDMRRDIARMNPDTTATFVPAQPPPRIPPFRNTPPAELARPRLPVLLPLETEPASTRGEEEGGGVEGMMFFASDYFYSASFHRRGIMYQITGTRIVHAVEGSPDIAARYLGMTNAEGQLVTRNEFGQELSFNRYGAAYTLLIACANPDESAECRDENTIRGFAGRLVVAGGSPEGLPPRSRPGRQP